VLGQHQPHSMRCAGVHAEAGGLAAAQTSAERVTRDAQHAIDRCSGRISASPRLPAVVQAMNCARLIRYGGPHSGLCRARPRHLGRRRTCRAASWTAIFPNVDSSRRRICVTSTPSAQRSSASSRAIGPDASTMRAISVRAVATSSPRSVSIAAGELGRTQRPGAG